MVDIQVVKCGEKVTLKVVGELDGSSAWRVIRLALRLRRGQGVGIDLSGVSRMVPFGAAVLAQGLRDAGATIVAARREHRGTLAAEELVAGAMSGSLHAVEQTA